MNILLTIEVPYNFDAEDELSNTLQDEAMLHDLIANPVRYAIWEYLNLSYGGQLQIEVTAQEPD